MIGLDEPGRDFLESVILDCRKVLEEDLTHVAEGRFGIYANGQIDDEAALKLSAAEMVERRDVVGIVQHLRQNGESSPDAVRRLLREAAFTHLNRLVAVRVAEAIGLLSESIANGRSSRGFRDLLEIAPSLRSDETGGYWTYLRYCAEELASDAPVLFDPRNPLLDLAPSAAAVDQLVERLATPDNPSIWSAPDTLGWAYQFFNTAQERSEMRAQAAPRGSRELAVRNQFFTPRYVVDFLVQNTLGRRLLEAGISLDIDEDLPFLVDPPVVGSHPVDLAEINVLDPACGSGHFLLGCYDLLERAWTICGASAAEAAPRIMPCLWGIDIDPRCAQVAAAALALRARQASPQGALSRPNIITARAMPEDPAAWAEAERKLSSERRRLLAGMRDSLRRAPILGSLLKAEAHLEEELERTVTETAGGVGGLFASQASAAMTQAEQEVLSTLEMVAYQATATPAERLLAAEAGDALRFLAATRRRYDVVLMNPPFGEPVPETKPYLKAAYPWIPSKDYNLLAAFVGRGLDLCNETGYLGAITSRVGMFLTTFQAWRREVLLGHGLVALADLGNGVMQQAMVEAAAFVLSARRPTSEDEQATFIRLLKDRDRSTALRQATFDMRRGAANERIYRMPTQAFQAIPGAPVAYWMADEIRRLFSTLPCIEGTGADVRQGVATADDGRFVRAIWEIQPSRIARTRQQTFEGRPWVPFAKGGEYSPYWADIHLVVNYERDGEPLRLSGSSVIRNPKYYFRSGLTWPDRTASGFGPRLLPAGCVFGHMGPSAFARSTDDFMLLAWLSSRIARGVIETLVAAGDETSSGGAARHYLPGVVAVVPWGADQLTAESGRQLSSLARNLATSRAELDRADETTRLFTRPAVIPGPSSSLIEEVHRQITNREERALASISASYEIDQCWETALNLTAESTKFIDDVMGRHPAAFANKELDSEQDFVRLYTMPLHDAIDEIVNRKGGARSITNLTFIADRRLEVLAHALERHPSVLVASRRSSSILPPEQPTEFTKDLVSYLVGISFGRWDIRIGAEPDKALGPADLLDPVALCPPGMLVDDQGMPAREAPPGYPQELPADRILADQPGHPWDVDSRIRLAATSLFDEHSDAIIDDVERVLGTRIGDYLRKQFFKDHLSKYTKSRRKAPIYWQLSVPSRGWGIWLYAPFLTRETLYAVARYAARRLEEAEKTIGGLRTERAEGGRGRSLRDIDRHLQAEESLVVELKAFHAEADRLARLGWEPDLEDGMVLCAAPLADLFPAWPEATVKRNELRQGAYAWASVAKWSKDL